MTVTISIPGLRHLVARQIDWLMAGWSTYLGCWYLMPWVSMPSPVYDGVTDVMPETCWGVVFLAGGLLHLLALSINGGRGWTPGLRIAVNGLMAVVYVQYLLAFQHAAPGTTAVAIYSLLAVTNIFTVWRAARDWGAR